MLEVYVTINVFCILILLKKRIKIIRYQNYLSIFDGLFFGGCFFIVLPICYSFFIGQISTVGLPNFEPHNDYKLVLYAVTSITIFGCSSIMFSKNRRSANTQIKSFEKLFFSLTLILYFLSLIISFISSGKLSGGSHWYRANENLFEKNSLFVLLGQMHNVGRVVIPGLCMYFQLNYLNKGKYFKQHFVIATIVVIFELFLAGNRIVILFFVFSIVIPLIVYEKYKRLIYISVICLPLLIVAKFWPMVRGMIWAEQVSIERVIDVMGIAYESEIVSDNGESDPIMILTEGSNIVSLKYVVDNFPGKYDYTYGDTMVLKSLGALVPKSIWPSKPDGVGNLVGEVALSGVSLYLNVTILGDAWSNFSWLGIFYIIIMLIVIQNYFKLKYFKLLTSIFFMVAIASWRFDFSFYFITIYILFFYFFLIKITPIRNYCFKLSKVIFR